MGSKHLLAVFLVFCWFLLAASPSLQGSYDQNVASRFLGKWNWLVSTEPEASSVVIEDHRTYATFRKCNYSNCTTDTRLFTQGDKLVSSGNDEFVILPNGHLLHTKNVSGGWQKFEYQRTSVQSTAAECSEGLSYHTSPSLPGFTVFAEENKSWQCVSYVRTRRADTARWAKGDAHDWDEAARNAPLNLNLPAPTRDPWGEGDIVVWENAAENGGKQCQNASKTYGHVAFVTNAKTYGDSIVVDEANWITNQYPDGDGKIYQGQSYNVDRSCMWFIHLPGSTSPPQSSQNLWDTVSQFICKLLRRCS